MPPAADETEEVPVQPKSIKTLTSLMLKRTYDMFVGNHSQKLPLDEQAQRTKIASKVRTVLGPLLVHFYCNLFLSITLISSPFLFITTDA
jgi:hypothetical protein